MATKAKPAPEPVRPIIVKKIVVEGHGGHHGGAWKIAYADFVTAMMAFFLLMWLLGMTDEEKRKGLADYFTPTLIQTKQGSAGSNTGLLGGESLTEADDYPHRAGQTGSRSLTIPRDATGGPREGSGADLADRARLAALRKKIEERINAAPDLRALAAAVRMVDTREGLQIDLMDKADYAMFETGTDRLSTRAAHLVREVASVIASVPNAVIVRGHTDGLPYARGQAMNNWMLSTARAEGTRLALGAAGVAADRFARIEGVADREPLVAADRYDPRNRRIAITLVAASR